MEVNMNPEQVMMTNINLLIESIATSVITNELLILVFDPAYQKFLNEEMPKKIELIREALRDSLYANHGLTPQVILDIVSKKYLRDDDRFGDLNRAPEEGN